MSKIAVQIAEKLLQINAIKLNPQNPFTWASGIKSPIYCDNRIALSDPTTRSLICDGFSMQSMRFFPFYGIAGVATAGIAHGALVAQRLDKPFAYVRSKPKEHGRQNQIEGKVEADTDWLMIEDLVSTGGSVLKAMDAMEEVGARVKAVFSIFTYGFEEAVESFKQRGVDFVPLLEYTTLIEIAIKNNYISEDQSAVLMEWRKDPKNWNY